MLKRYEDKESQEKFEKIADAIFKNMLSASLSVTAKHNRIQDYADNKQKHIRRTKRMSSAMRRRRNATKLRKFKKTGY